MNLNQLLTLDVGTRMAAPSSLPASSGKTNPTALAAPVDVEPLRMQHRVPYEVTMKCIECWLVAGIGMQSRHIACFYSNRII